MPEKDYFLKVFKRRLEREDLKRRIAQELAAKYAARAEQLAPKGKVIILK